MDRLLSRDHAVLHQQHPAARRRHASGRVPRGADPHRQQLRQRKRHRQEGEDAAHRRGHARGPDLDPVGQGARPEILVADQGQAGLAPRSGRWSRASLPTSFSNGSRSTPPRRARIVAKVVEAAAAREAARQGARPDAAQGRRSTSRTLPGKLADCQERDPAQVRALHRRGRQRRRLGQAGARPPHPGDPAA